MEEAIGKEQTEYDNEKDAGETESSIDIFDMEDIMESMVKISFCGLGGTVIGLSLEKRLESMKLTTAEGVTAAARRKRGGMRTAHQSNLVTAWALSCIAFSSIIEVRIFFIGFVYFVLLLILLIAVTISHRPSYDDFVLIFSFFDID
jgi:hypothetical protein